MNRDAPSAGTARRVATRRVVARCLPARRAAACRLHVASACAALLLAAAPAAAEGLSGGGYVQPYPSQWPRLAGMSARCTELRGHYADPIPVDRAGVPPREGARYGAWAAFGIAMHTARADDPTVSFRRFTLDVRPDGGLSVRYATDGAEVATRDFPASEVSCGAEGLSLTAFDRGRLLPSRYANRSPDLVRSTLYRVGGHLYVRTDATTRMRWFGVVPVSSTVVSWQRFGTE
jgi:hypothetical protein